MRISPAITRLAFTAVTLVAFPAASTTMFSEGLTGFAQAAATGVQSSVGTVKTIAGGTLQLSTDKGDTVSFTLPGNVRVLQMAPGSTDLKTAQAASVADIAQGDRALVSGRVGDGGAVTALRVILMKSGAIAQNNETRQQDWQRRGSGGVVDTVDASAQTLTVTSGTRKETVTTTSATVFRRYAPGSVKFEDASLSKLGDIGAGDQVRVRGDKSADGTTIAADEIVSGAFRNVAGLITRVDATANTVTVNDLSTKKPMTISIAGDSDLRALPPEMAARFAARARGGASGQGAGASGVGTHGAGAPNAGASGQAAAADGQRAGNSEAAADGQRPAGQRPGGYGGGARGGDLSQVITRLPKTSVAELKPGEAVMVVASGAGASGGSLTVVTLLSGVEPLLAASPQGGANAFSISPWNLGGGGEGGGEGAGPQ